jgi:HEAT repeat protein
MPRHAPAALLLATLAWGCSRDAVRVTSVRVGAGGHERALAEAGIEPELQRETARDALREAGFRLVGGPPGYRARLEVRAAGEAFSEATGEQSVEVRVELQLVPEERPGAAAVSATGTGVVRLGGGRREAWRKALAGAVRQASNGLALALSAEQKPVEQLVADLRSDEPRRRDQAVRVLGDRRSAAAVPALIALLRDPDPALAEQAAGALARIGDRRAVGPIIDFSLELDGGRQTARYARIVGDMGGSEARGYLLTLESGHVDPEVRAAAREALADLDAREQEAARLAEKARTESSRPASGSMAR